MKGRLIVWIGALCVFASIASVVTIVASFDRSERRQTVTAALDHWKTDPDGRMRLSLGRFTVPSPGMLRVVVCPTPLADPHAVLSVRPVGASAARPTSEPLTADESRGSRCFDGDFRPNRLGDVTADVVVNASSARAIADVEVSASRRITPSSMWPVMLMLFGFLLVMIAPREPKPAAVDATLAPPLPRADTVPAEMPLGGIISPDLTVPGRPPPGFDPGPYRPGPTEPPSVDPPTFTDFVLGRPPPIRWRFSPFFAIAVYIGVHVAMIAIAGAYAVMRGGGEHITETGSFITFTMLVQHGMLIAAAYWFLGAVAARDRREALGLIPAKPLELLRAVGIAFALVAVAILVTHFIKDVSVSPMGQLVERMPIRYAIGFGALLAPFSEELFFRGVLYGAFAKRSPWIGVVASALIFTVSHAAQLSGASIGLIPIALVGTVNGVLRAKSGGITQSWVVHTVYNLTLSAGLYFA